MRKIFIGIFLLLATHSFSQTRETTDAASYIPPSGWTKEIKKNLAVTYSTTNKNTGTWCQLIVYMMKDSKGLLNTDFEHDWSALVVKNYSVKEPPHITSLSNNNNWELQKGTGSFTFNNVQGTVLLMTLTGFGKTMSIVCIMNNSSYMSIIEKYIASLEMKKLVSTHSLNEHVR